MGIIIRQSIKGTIVNYVGIAIGFFTTFFVLTFPYRREIGLTRVLIEAATLIVGLAQFGANSSIVRFYPILKMKLTKTTAFSFGRWRFRWLVFW